MAKDVTALAGPGAAPLALQTLTPERLSALVPVVTLAEARKIVAAVRRDAPLGRPVEGVRRVAIEAVSAACALPTLALRSEHASAVDPFRKLVFVTNDGNAIEAVRIPLERAGRFSVCVSSQAGCALACAFCATGRLGLRRNLESWEIVEQVRAVRRTLPPGARVHGIVFQGMGEPLANVERVIEALRVFSDPCAFAVDARSITVCTSGLPAGIRRLAREAPRVRLALSLASARPSVRRSLMPIDAAHPLDEVIDAVAEFVAVSRRAPLWAVTPLAGVNDTPDDARALAALVRDFVARTGVRPRVTLVPYNPIDDNPDRDPFRRSEPAAAAAFRQAMIEAGVVPHQRYSGGGDVAAACGQLAARA